MRKTDRIPSLIKHVVLVYDKAWFEVWERGTEEKKGLPGRGRESQEQTRGGRK